MRNAYRILIEKQTSYNTVEDNINMNLREIGCEDWRYFELAQQYV
jgi:hypothetical protein